jgi:phage host-nuclease inhibitor protein Gam
MSNVLTMIATAEAHPPAPEGPALLPEYVDEERQDVRLGWRIGELTEADWAFQRMLELEAQIAAVDLQAQAAIARVEKRAAELKEKAARGVEFFRAHLEEYGEREKRSLLVGKKKSRDLIHGTIAWRKKGGKLRWVDEAATLEWAKSRPVEQGLFRVSYSLEKKAIQDATRAENIIPPGTELEPEMDEIQIRTTKEG